MSASSISSWHYFVVPLYCSLKSVIYYISSLVFQIQIHVYSQHLRGTILFIFGMLILDRCFLVIMFSCMFVCVLYQSLWVCPFSMLCCVCLRANIKYFWNGNFSYAAHIVPMTPWMRLLQPFRLALTLVETSKHQLKGMICDTNSITCNGICIVILYTCLIFVFMLYFFLKKILSLLQYDVGCRFLVPRC